MSINEKWIDNIGLSTRSFNALRRAGIRTVGEMFELDEDKLSRIPQLGRLSVDEILAKIAELKETPDTPEDSGADAPPDLLAMLPPKAFNLLSLNDCKTKDKILSLTLAELLEMPFMDRATADSIIRTRDEYVAKAEAAGGSDPGFNKGVFALIKDPAYHDRIFDFVKENDVAVKNMGLHVRPENCLIRDGYNSMSDIVFMDRDALLRVRNNGVKSSNEILEKINAIDRSIQGLRIWIEHAANTGKIDEAE